MKKRTHYFIIMIILMHSVALGQSDADKCLIKLHNIEYDMECIIIDGGITKRFRWNVPDGGSVYGPTEEYDIDHLNNSKWMHSTGGLSGGNSSVLEGDCDNGIIS